MSKKDVLEEESKNENNDEEFFSANSKVTNFDPHNQLKRAELNLFSK